MVWSIFPDGLSESSCSELRSFSCSSPPVGDPIVGDGSADGDGSVESERGRLDGGSPTFLDEQSATPDATAAGGELRADATLDGEVAQFQVTSEADFEDAEVLGVGGTHDARSVALDGDALGDQWQAVAVLVGGEGVGTSRGEAQGGAAVGVGVHERGDQLLRITGHLHLPAVGPVVPVVVPARTLLDVPVHGFGDVSRHRRRDQLPRLDDAHVRRGAQAGQPAAGDADRRETCHTRQTARGAEPGPFRLASTNVHNPPTNCEAADSQRYCRMREIHSASRITPDK
ncbi:hypothetical protein [Actinopolymorpha pittospori]|uniref:Uncharacterized protein n=1 Tax=Actinopolymorpha pittospori TaxID=648752 RepID=A0A927MMI7_9ACTN|nr:hypothetical protein [Actinopolymorpha pittospori]MBE1603264.1 hypothetical protein [Actinopolymorpha pittospori]